MFTGDRTQSGIAKLGDQSSSCGRSSTHGLKIIEEKKLSLSSDSDNKLEP